MMNSENKPVSRRNFLLQGSAALAAVTTLPALAQQASHGRSTKVLHLIGYSHIDAAWLWPWRDGADTVLTTFRSALNRMQETPGFCYSHSSSAHYRWVERTDPRMFSEIKQRIREERWEVVGGWPVEPDCNIPSTESFARHALYGKTWCQRHLGADVTIGFNPDSFGHAAGLPSILKHSGYRYYVFMRPQEHEMDLPLLFWWEAADGSRVLALRIWHSYDADAKLIQPAAAASFAPGFDDAAFFLGVGDHGGAVTKEQIQQVLAMRQDTQLPELRFSTLRGFFQAVEASPALASLPVVHGELQHHARGCYSAYGEGKILNRRAERTLRETETMSLIANLSAGRPYASEQLAEAWWKVLFCQFHDMMAGTSLYSDYQDVRDSLGYACEVAQTEKIEALETMARRVDLSTLEESALFLFNPLPWKRKALVECYAEQNPSRKAPITHLVSQAGEKIPLQWRPSASMTNFFPRLSAWVDLPPCGYKVFALGHGDAPAALPFARSITVSNAGFGISSWKAQDGTELLASAIGLVVIADPSDTWAHGINQFREEIGRPKFVSSTVIEEGPVTRVTRHRATWQDSEIVLDLAQFAGLDLMELRFVIDWRQHEQMLKLEIPTALTEPTFFAKVPGEVLQRRTDGQEEPYQDWGAVQGKIGDKDYTVALINNSTYSYDCLQGLFRTVLIRSAPFARHIPNQVPRDDNNAWQDQGRQERRFWLLGGSGPYSGFALDRRAEELQTPAEYVMDSAHHGTEAWEQTFLEVQPDNVWVLAIKRAELLQNATVIRLQERSGKATQATIKSAALGLNQAVQLGPWELKTLMVTASKQGASQVREVSLLET